MRGAQKIINLSAIKHNVSQIKQQAPHAKCIAAVKANAYGHGVPDILPALDSVDLFAVSSIEEALPIRQHNNKKPILLLEGLLGKEELKIAINNQLEIVITMPQQLTWELQSSHQFNRIWLKIDTGMGRLGFNLATAQQAIDQLLTKYPQKNVVLMTHFSSSDNTDKSITLNQISAFDSIAKNYPHCQQSLCNSAGTFAFPQAHRDYIRAGIALYGSSPFEHQTAQSLNLKPAMTLKTKVLSIKTCKKDSPIGYGQNGKMPHDGYIAICEIGYADGYLRFIPSNTPILINNRLFKTIGRVSMDLLAVVVDEHVKVNDEVICWGDDLSIDSIAKSADTISYQLLSTVTNRPKTIIKE